METTSPSINVITPIAGPAMKAAGALVAGILAGTHLQLHLLTIILMSVTAIVLLIAFHRHDRVGSLFALAVMFVSGMLVFSIHCELNRPLHLPGHFTHQVVRVEGLTTGNTGIYYGNTRFTLQCQSLQTETGTNSVRGLLPCTLYSRKIHIPEGSRILIRGKIKRFRSPIKNSGIVRFSPYTNFTHRLVVDSTTPEPVIIERGTPFFGRIRDHMSHLIDRYPFGGYGDLLKTMTIGERGALSPSVKARFAQSGIAHVLAVSGLHVGILALALNFVLRLFPLPKKFRIPIIICVLIFYTGICGFRAPVTRAVVMISMVFGALVFERPKNVENSIFIALIAILAFDPVSLFGPSLQLSFAAIWGITTFYTPISGLIKKRFRMNKPVEYLVGLFIVSAIATMTTAPIVAAHFGWLPLYGIAVNLIAVPLTVIIVNLGMVSIFLISLGLIAAPLAVLSSFITGIALQVLSGITGFVSGLPYAMVLTGNVSPLVGVSFMVWLYVISRAKGRNSYKKTILYIPLVLLLVWTWYPLLATGRFGEREGSVVFFDVGQGDATLVSYGNIRHFLVDTGPRYGTYDAGSSIIVPGLKSAGITNLDGIFLSHTHIDHSGGIESILQGISIDHIFCRRSIADSLRNLFGSRVIGVSAGDSIAFTEGGIQILSPVYDEQVFYTRNITGENNYSLLVRFDICGVRLLFTGDIENDVQRLMISWKNSLGSDVLKVPHHGAAGLHDEFIGVIRPKLAIITCGALNRYGHPAATTLSTLKQHGCTVWRTDHDGTILVMLPSLHVLPL